jgi:hypothetical protein
VTACPLQRQPRWTDDSTLDDVLHLMEQVAETILLKENVKLPFDRQEREELRAGYRDWLIEAAENTDLCLHYNRYMALRILIGVQSVRLLMLHLEHAARVDSPVQRLEGILAVGAEIAQQMRDATQSQFLVPLMATQPHFLWGLKNSENLQKGSQTRNKAQTELRAPEWARWRAEADKVRRETPALLKVRSVAARVKKRLKLDDSVETIRKRIK